MISTLFLLAMGLFVAWEIATDLDERNTIKAFSGMPVALAVLILVGCIAAGTFFLTRALIHHHWISN